MEDDSKSEYENTGPASVDVTSPLPLLPLRDVVDNTDRFSLKRMALKILKHTDNCNNVNNGFPP